MQNFIKKTPFFVSKLLYRNLLRSYKQSENYRQSVSMTSGMDVFNDSNAPLQKWTVEWVADRQGLSFLPHRRMFFYLNRYSKTICQLNY